MVGQTIEFLIVIFTGVSLVCTFLEWIIKAYDWVKAKINTSKDRK